MARSADKAQNSQTKQQPLQGTGSARALCVHEHLNRGLALHSQGRVHEALAEYRMAIDLDADDPYGRYLAGLALKAVGQDSEAAAEWECAEGLSARDEDSAWGLAMARKLLDSSF